MVFQVAKVIVYGTGTFLYGAEDVTIARMLYALKGGATSPSTALALIKIIMTSLMKTYPILGQGY